LLQSHPGDIFGDADQVENRRDDLHHDVEENVSKLNSAFIVDKKRSQPES